MTERNSVEKLHYGRTCCIGLAYMGISAFWRLYDNIIPLILKNTFTLGDTATGVVMALDNAFAVALMVVALSAFLSYIPLGIAATKLGRRNVIRAGFSLMTISFVAITFINEYHAWVNVLFVVVGVGGSAVGVNIFPVIVDMRDNSELGKYTGLYYTFSMSAQIITLIASGFLLEHVSYLTLFPYAAAFSLFLESQA